MVVKPTKSIYFRNLLTIGLILLISFAIMAGMFSFVTYRFTMREKREQMLDHAQEAVRLISAYSSEWGLGDLSMRVSLSSISRMSGYHFLLCDNSGYVVSCSDARMDCPHIGCSVAKTSLDAMAKENKVYLADMGGVYDNMRYSVAARIVYAGSNQQVGYIILSEEEQAVSELWKDFFGIYPALAVIVMALAFMITIVTTKRQAQPLQEMAAAVRKFAKGDFSVRMGKTAREDEIRELANAFNVMADSLERSEKQRRELIANVSHELKTPMTTITGFADGLLDGAIPPERQDHYLRIISSETRRLSRMVRSMLDISQLEVNSDSMNNETFDIVDLVCLTLGSLEQRITGKGLDVSATLPEEKVIVCGSRDSITQVVYNLIDNAAKFSPEGHVIRVELWKQDGKAFVSVENDGETIPKDELPLIFDRFHKTDRSRNMDKEGVGLGLYIVKTIIDAHNEDIFVTSENGITKFAFSMRLKQ